MCTSPRQVASAWLSEFNFSVHTPWEEESSMYALKPVGGKQLSNFGHISTAWSLLPPSPVAHTFFTRLKIHAAPTLYFYEALPNALAGIRQDRDSNISAHCKLTSAILNPLSLCFSNRSVFLQFTNTSYLPATADGCLHWHRLQCVKRTAVHQRAIILQQ